MMLITRSDETYEVFRIHCSVQITVRNNVHIMLGTVKIRERADRFWKGMCISGNTLLFREKESN